MWTEALVPGMGDSQHDVVSAHASLRECEEAVRVYLSVLKQDGYTVSGGLGGSRGVVAGKKGTERRAYRCLPDTVDPRGPKGGGR